jgi:hypothetical protein
MLRRLDELFLNRRSIGFSPRLGDVITGVAAGRERHSRRKPGLGAALEGHDRFLTIINGRGSIAC